MNEALSKKNDFYKYKKIIKKNRRKYEFLFVSGID